MRDAALVTDHRWGLAALSRRVVTADVALARWVDATWARPAVLCVALALALLAGAAVRLYPFVDDVTPERALNDDWLVYKERALSILRDGLAMRIEAGPHSPPRGFLYSYFIAGVFALFGENSAYVYLVQAAMLGVGVGLMYLAFRPWLPPGAGALYLAVLTASSTVDVFWKYTVRLLSENLALFWLAPFFFASLRVLTGPPVRWSAAAGACLGLAALARPHLAILAPAMVAWVALATRPRRWRAALALLVPFGLLLSLMAVRDYVVTGRLDMGSITSTRGWTPPHAELGASPTLRDLLGAAGAALGALAVRVLYCLGFLFVLGAKYPLMPHWILMWAGAGAFVGERVRRRQLEAWQALPLLQIVLSLLPPILLSSVENYGVRMILPVVPAAWLLAVLWAAERPLRAGGRVLAAPMRGSVGRAAMGRRGG